MPRPNKSGLDYFSLDVDLDEKFELIEARYGLKGFGLIIKLFQQIYKNGYFYHLTDDKMVLMAHRFGTSETYIFGVINDAVKWGIFNEKIYLKYSILTSRGIQKRYIEGTRRRRSVDWIRELALEVTMLPLEQNFEQIYSKEVNVNIYSINDAITGINVDKSTQSKVKESKEAVTPSGVTGAELKNSSPPPGSKMPPEPPPPDKIPTVEIPLIKRDGYYAIYDEQITEWQEDYPGVDILGELIKIKNWNKSNPKKRKTKNGIMNHITNWLGREQDKSKTNGGRQRLFATTNFREEKRDIARRILETEDGAQYQTYPEGDSEARRLLPARPENQ